MARRRLAGGGPGGGASPPAERVEFNRAAGRGLDILTAFTAGDQFLGNAEIAHRTGIPRSTVSRITATLTELGYLNYADQLGKYEIGPRVLALSYSLMSKLRVHTTARPLMEQLARDSNAIVGLGMLDGSNVVFVESALGERPYSQQPQVGFRVPAAFTAMGWACLSFLTVEERAAALCRMEQAHPDRATEIRRNVQQALSDVWQRGFCASFGALEPAFNAIGVPYWHPDGRHIMAFHMSAPNTVLTRKAIAATWGPRLAKLADQVRSAGTGPTAAPHQGGAETPRHEAR